ncbi:hypothetical protein IHE44_0002578, partial [Lamprotornis superbus]
MTLWNGSYPFYPGANACFPFDTTRAVIVTVFLSILVMFIIILPGIPGRRRLFWFLRLVLGLFLGAVILSEYWGPGGAHACPRNGGERDWETGWVQANTSYKSFSPVQVNMDIGLHIGLAGVNVTLRGNPVNQINETINYNEHFPWNFGADYDHSYNEGLKKGLPSPILYVAEKFSTQSPCAVHRQYRIAGHYMALTLWLAFCTWLISILLFSMSILLYGGHMLLLTATLILFSLLLFSTVRNTLKCPIQFGPVSLKTDYGESFWLTLATGLLCLLLGLGIIILNSVQPEKLKLIFSLDKSSKEEVWDKSCLPAEPSCSAQDGLIVPFERFAEEPPRARLSGEEELSHGILSHPIPEQTIGESLHRHSSWHRDPQFLCPRCQTPSRENSTAMVLDGQHVVEGTMPCQPKWAMTYLRPCERVKINS